jgi:hypothetical protein
MMIEIEALATKAQRESSWVTPDRSGRNVDLAHVEGQGGGGGDAQQAVRGRDGGTKAAVP